MTIRVKCDGCGSVLKIKDELAGKGGSCPKCKAEFKIPAASEAAEAPADGVTPAAAATEENATSEEDDIFGKDFFKMPEAPTKPKYTTPKFDDEPVKEPTKKPAAVKAPEPERASSTDAAADIAGKLLAKTGKKNKSQEQIQAELKADQETEKLDLTEVKYLVSHKVLPMGAGALVLVLGLYWLMNSMFGDKAKHPDLGNVTGIVTLDGKPAANAEVRFTPAAGTATPGEVSKWSQSYGTTDAQGAYSLSYTKDLTGGVIGPNKAQVMILGRPFEKDVEVKAGSNDIPLAFQSN